MKHSKPRKQLQGQAVLQSFNPTGGRVCFDHEEMLADKHE